MPSRSLTPSPRSMAGCPSRSAQVFTTGMGGGCFPGAACNGTRPAAATTRGPKYPENDTIAPPRKEGGWQRGLGNRRRRRSLLLAVLKAHFLLTEAVGGVLFPIGEELDRPPGREADDVIQSGLRRVPAQDQRQA